MNDHIANTLIVFGAVLISLGFGIIHVAAGLIVLGTLCLFGGWILAINGLRK